MKNEVRIKLDKKLEKFYDEFLSIIFIYNSKKNKKDPKQRICLYTNKIKFWLFIFGILIIHSIISIIIEPTDNTISLILSVIFLAFILGLFIYFFIVYLSVKNDIKEYNSKPNNNAFLVLNKKGIIFEKENIKTNVDWDNIKYILINKYTIAFISINDKVIVAINKLYLNEIMDGISKYNKMNLAIDNSDLYKKTNIKEMFKKDINNLLLTLFIISCFTPFISILGWYAFSSITNTPMQLASYGALIGLIAPLLSIIFGLKYKSKDTTKNIVIGIVMTIVTLGVTLSSNISIFETSDKIVKNSNYQEIIGEVVPSGIVNFNYNQKNSPHILSIIIKENKEAINFYRKLQKNTRWIDEDNINTALEYFIHDKCYSETKKCLYLIYNEDNKTYNEVPKESGSYRIKEFVYNPNNNNLIINEFDTDYKK